ncbi:MAG: polysaccharide deacetylase family protein [Balneolaceae bacterium]|nr:polysaccharide deacetylase family protein [Balneolaceae bacterium]
MLTVVMYHYVREIGKSRYPNIKGLEAELFRKQLNYLNTHYSFITMEELIASFEESYDLPKNSVLLTFDDGYLDHYSYVFPLLDSMKIQGSFFIPVKPILESKVLDVNKIHFLLATTSPEKLLQSIKDMLDGIKNETGIQPFDEYYNTLAKPNRFDPAEIIFIKRLLQHQLPEPYRSELIDRLFEAYFHISEVTLSKELYLTMDQCRCMAKYGMHIGAHTYDHFWLNKISEKEQVRQFNLNLDFLDNLGIAERTMAYPFGGYNDKTLKLMQEFNFTAGFTTQADTVKDLKTASKFELPRLDTNDIPKETQRSVPKIKKTNQR